MAAAAALSVRGLEVRFGSVVVCSGIDLDLPDGAVGALVGGNGAGKSTILRALAGVIPARGSVRLFGEELGGLSPRQRVRRGLVLAAGGRGTFSSLTVAESLGVGISGGVDEAFSLFPALADRRGVRCRDLSAGEQHLVTLARGLLARARVLLVDELTLGLAGALADQVSRVVTDRGNVVVVDQSIGRALALAHQAWYLERGGLAFHGTPHDLAQRHDLLRPVLLA